MKISQDLLIDMNLLRFSSVLAVTFLHVCLHSVVCTMKQVACTPPVQMCMHCPSSDPESPGAWTKPLSESLTQVSDVTLWGRWGLTLATEFLCPPFQWCAWSEGGCFRERVERKEQRTEWTNRAQSLTESYHQVRHEWSDILVNLLTDQWILMGSLHMLWFLRLDLEI